jgi:hypothetical protein
MVNGRTAVVRLDSLGVEFDDERLVANAGLMLTSTLSERLGIARLVDETVDLGERPGSAWPGRKVLSLVHAIAAGADSIDDCDVLRAGRTEAVLGHRAMAPSTLGTFLRSFTFGHVRQLDRVLGEALRRAWTAGGGRGQAGSGRGALRFCQELIARVRRAGAKGEILLRGDSGFWNKKVTAYLAERGCRYSLGVTMHKVVVERIAQIPEQAWQPVADYPDAGICELAETTLGSDRLVVRRVHLHAQDEQTELFSYWRHFAFITNRSEPVEVVDREHRQHAEVELVIRDLKDQALAHFPSGRFAANGAWTALACLAHNLQRWSGLLGLKDPIPRAARTIRRRLLAIPGRLTRTARQWTLHLPAGWPWQQSFVEALTRIRALPAAV